MSLCQFAAVAALMCSTAMPVLGQRADTLRLSVQDAVTLALRANGTVRLADAQLAATEAQVTTARATGLPQLNFTGSYSRAIENARGNAIGQVFNQPLTYNASLRASQTLFQGFRIFSGARAANRLREASHFTAEETRAQTALDTQRAYLTALTADRLATIQAQNVSLSDARLGLLQQRFNAGQSSRYDVMKAKVERANAEPLLIQARNDRELALLELKRLLNVAPEQPVTLVSMLDVPQIERTVSIALTAQASPFASEVDRPSVRAAVLTARAREEGVRVARGGFLPTVSVFYQRGYLAFPTAGFPPGAGELGVQFCPAGSAAGRVCNNGGWFSDRQAGVNVSWPLFDGLLTKGNLDFARAQLQVARVQADQVALTVATEVARARSSLERAQAAFTAQREAAGEATEVFQLASLRFTRGLDTQLELSDAQLSLLIARTNEARAGMDLWLAYADLERARGRAIPAPPVTTGSPLPRAATSDAGSLNK